MFATCLLMLLIASDVLLLIEIDVKQAGMFMFIIKIRAM